MGEIIFRYLKEEEIKTQLQIAAIAIDKPKDAEKFFGQFRYELDFSQGNFIDTIKRCAIIVFM